MPANESRFVKGGSDGSLYRQMNLLGRDPSSFNVRRLARRRTALRPGELRLCGEPRRRRRLSGRAGDGDGVRRLGGSAAWPETRLGDLSQIKLW